LQVYQDYGWVLLNPPDSAPLPPVGSQLVKIEHPRNFGPVTFRLSIVDLSGTVLDERALVIPYDTGALAEMTPEIQSFATNMQTIDAATIAAGGVQVQVTWNVVDRLPLTNLVFEQVLGEDQTVNVELPRTTLWIPSSGTGTVVPVQPTSGNQINLRLRVVDVITADVYAESLVTITIIGSALPPAPGTAETPAPTPLPAAADLTILADCPRIPITSPQRGWIDGPGVSSPDTTHYVYAANPDGDAKLIIARADGSGQIDFDAPNKGIPIGIQPRWSPDSQRIAFANIVISQPGGGTIFVVKADGRLRPWWGMSGITTTGLVAGGTALFHNGKRRAGQVCRS
jgi:hypothetical protein